MRFKITLFLLFLNVAVFGFLYFTQRGAPKEKAGPARIVGPEVADLTALTLSGPRFPAPISLVKTTTGWKLTEPIEWPANPNAVNRIVNELQFLRSEASFSVGDLGKAGQSLADYGLETPPLLLAYAAGGTRRELRIGSVTSVDNRLYVLSPDGQRIHVVGRSLADSLTLAPEQLRDDAVLTIPVFEARSLSLQAADPAGLKIRLLRENTRWMFEVPSRWRASKAAVELLLNRLNALRVASFVPPAEADPTRTGLANPAWRITLEGNGRNEILLLGGAVEPAAAKSPGLLYAKLEDHDAVFTLRGDLLETLRTAQVELRERRLLDFASSEVTRLTLGAPGQPEIVLQRLETSDRWQVISRPDGQPPLPEPADSALIARLLDKLLLAEAVSFVNDAPSAENLENYGFNRPERVLILAFRPAAAASTPDAAAPRAGGSLDQPPVTLLLGGTEPGTGDVYARLENARSVTTLPPDLLIATPLDALHYRDRLLRELPPDARITGLKITQLADGAVVLEKAIGREPPAEPAVAALVGQLRALRAERFVLDRFPPAVEIGGESRPWKYLLEASYATDAAGSPPPAALSLHLSERFGNEQFAGLADARLVFVPAQPLVDALFSLLYQPPAVETTPAPAAEK